MSTAHARMLKGEVTDLRERVNRHHTVDSCLDSLQIEIEIIWVQTQMGEYFNLSGDLLTGTELL